jgi:hypothetical protein
MPDSVTSIGNEAFRNCTSLASITIPDSVKTIGYSAFVNCTSLTSIVIPDSVTSIDYSAFQGCTSLTSVTIPNSVTSIGVWAFGENNLNLTIYGEAGSYAESYAIENNIRFSTDTPFVPRDATARPTASTVLVNGEQTAFDAYLIEGSNYFKLRDLAHALNGSEKQFEVSWDAAHNAISLTSGAAYTSVGGEMAVGVGRQNVQVISAMPAIYLDGEQISLTAYNIGGNNFFKLRDIMELFDVYVGWDNAANTIIIDTTKNYTE